MLLFSLEKDFIPRAVVIFPSLPSYISYMYTYTIFNEKSWAEVADEFCCSIYTLKELNKGLGPAPLRGAKVKVPENSCMGGVFHTLRRGRGLAPLLHALYATPEEFFTVNPGLNAARLRPGQVVILPFKGRARTKKYAVQRWDYLGKLLIRLEMGVCLLDRLNPETDIFSLRAGDELQVVDWDSSKSEFYAIEQGESFASIVKKTGVDAEELLYLNFPLLPQDYREGKEIFLPK